MNVMKLKNVYTGEIVLCKDINETTKGDNITFIRVFKEEYPQRTFLVNQAAFKVIE